MWIAFARASVDIWTQIALLIVSKLEQNHKIAPFVACPDLSFWIFADDPEKLLSGSYIGGSSNVVRFDKHATPVSISVA